MRAGVGTCVALLALAGAGSWLALVGPRDADALPVLWPAAGLVCGLLLVAPRSWRPILLVAALVASGVPWLLQGAASAAALGFALSYLAAAVVTCQRLQRGHRRAELQDEGDVSRLIGAVALGGAVAGLGCGATTAALDLGSPWTAAASGFGGAAAAMMVLVPLFMPLARFRPLAEAGERVTMAVITLGTTALVFSDLVPAPIIFVVMPMFGWHAYRGSLREATWLLVATAVIATGLTSAGIGPIEVLTTRYDLAPDLAHGVLQLFVLDCGLLLLPLSIIVTEHRKATALATAERRTLQRLIESAHGTAIVATDRDDRVSVFNPAAERLWGYAAADVVGGTADLLWSAEERHRLAAELGCEPAAGALCRASAEQGEVPQLWRSQGQDGSHRIVRVSVSSIVDERGEHAGHLVTAEDVTEREAAQQALLETLEHQQVAVDRLEEVERVKGDFVATVSHELRTPITSIIGYTEVLEDGAVGELTPGQRDVLSRVERNGRRLLALVEDLLTLSQIETSRLRLEPEQMDLREVACRAHRRVAETVAGRDLELVLDLPEQPVVHEVDPTQLTRMLVNLLTNAVKFTPDGGRVALRVRRVDDGTQVVVSDTGLGIPEHEQERLFTRFFRSAVASEQAIQGTGLGLTIVQAIVALHRGTVSLSSAEGHGTEAVVWLPAHQAGVGPESPRRPEAVA